MFHKLRTMFGKASGWILFISAIVVIAQDADKFAPKRKECFNKFISIVKIIVKILLFIKIIIFDDRLFHCIITVTFLLLRTVSKAI